MTRICAPEVDMLLVSQNSRNQRKSIINFAPRIGLSIVNYGRLQEIDNFYLECQNFRDYYRDPNNKIPRPDTFKRHYGKCGNRFQDKRSAQLRLPICWVADKQPVIYPLHFFKNLPLDEGVRLEGKYYSTPCKIYKH